MNSSRGQHRPDGLFVKGSPVVRRPSHMSPLIYPWLVRGSRDVKAKCSRRAVMQKGEEGGSS